MITYAKNAKIYSNGNVQQYETYYNHKLSECLDAILVLPTTQPVDENANRKYGWDICLINTQVGPIEGNLIIVNIETIKEKNKKILLQRMVINFRFIKMKMVDIHYLARIL